MITLRPAEERGHGNHGWLDSRHTFSFADYRDPQQMGFRSLRVINEDRVAPGQGFGRHPHRDMEIVSYVLEGALEHQDSLGNGAKLHRGEFQRISAGTGIEHSEFNPSPTDLVHFYQIWLLPDRKGIEPSYEQKQFGEAEMTNQWQLVAAPAATNKSAEGSLSIHQDARIYLAMLDADRELNFALEPGRYAWIQLLRGQVRLNGNAMQAGDGAAVSDEPELSFSDGQSAQIMLFDLA